MRKIFDLLLALLLLALFLIACIRHWDIYSTLFYGVMSIIQCTYVYITYPRTPRIENPTIKLNSEDMLGTEIIVSGNSWQIDGITTDFNSSMTIDLSKVRQ